MPQEFGLSYRRVAAAYTIIAQAITQMVILTPVFAPPLFSPSPPHSHAQARAPGPVLIIVPSLISVSSLMLLLPAQLKSTAQNPRTRLGLAPKPNPNTGAHAGYTLQMLPRGEHRPIE